MIHHIVFFRVKDEAAGLQKSEILQKLKADIDALLESVPTLATMDVGINVKEADAASDLALVSTFESWDDLHAYVVHPAHQDVVAFVQEVATERRVVDYEV